MASPSWCDGAERLARGQTLKQLVIGLVNALNDLVCPGPAAPGVDVLEAGQCFPGHVFSAVDHSVKSFSVPRTALVIPESTGPTGVVENDFSSNRHGELEFPQRSEVTQALPWILLQDGDVMCVDHVRSSVMGWELHGTFRCSTFSTGGPVDPVGPCLRSKHVWMLTDIKRILVYTVTHLKIRSAAGFTVHAASSHVDLRYKKLRDEESSPEAFSLVRDQKSAEVINESCLTISVLLL